MSVDDLLSLEAFGQAAISPDGRWAVYERRGAYDTLERVDLGGQSVRTLMDLWVADLDTPSAPPRQLLPGEGPGLELAAWSPSGSRLLVTRLQGGAFEYGVVSMAERAVRWIGLAPELPLNGAFAAWASDETVLLLVRPDGGLPLALGYNQVATRRRAAAWERTARGRQPARTVMDAAGGVVTTEDQEPGQALVRLDLRDGRARVLAEGRIADFALSPDGRAVALVSRAESIPLGRPELLHMEDDRRRRLVVLDLETGERRTEAPGLDVAPHLLRWSADSGAVLVWARPDGRRWDEGGLVSVGDDGVTRYELERLVAGSSAEIVLGGVRADWIGKRPVLLAATEAGGRRDWRLLGLGAPPLTLSAGLAQAPGRIAAAGEDGLQVFADGALWAMTSTGTRRLTPAGLTVREATPFNLSGVRRLKANEAPRRAWTAAIDADHRVLILDEGGVMALDGEGGAHDRVLALGRRAALVLHPEGLSEGLQLRSGDATARLDGVNRGLADVVLTEAQPIAHLDWQGVETTSWLFLPPGAEESIRGLIVSVYPGWADNLARVDPFTMTYSRRPEVYVSAGYAVLSPMIPAGLSAEERGAAYVASVDLAVDAALARFPQLPEDRMVLSGHSFGGYAALEIATRSSRFQSYIASAPYSDLFGVWGAFDAVGRIQPKTGMFFRFNQGWSEVGQGALEAPPWDAPELYAASSPFLRADRISRPVLLLTADLDFAPMTQAERMFSAILRTGGQARLVTYWGESHLIWSPANIRDYYAQIFHWLELTLGPAASVRPPDPAALPTSAPSPHTPLP
ncbi:MAG: hypothetical protein C0461_10910 [Brevundimonas sp.]|nr:hypothetical protein [Brevundimonas sp.]